MIPELTEAMIVKIEPGDVIVFKVDRPIRSRDQMTRIEELLRKPFPDNKIVILEPGMDLEIFRQNSES